MENLSRQKQVADSAVVAEPLVHPINPDKPRSVEMPMQRVFVIFFLVIVVGVLSGFGVSYVNGARSGNAGTTNDAGTTTMDGNKDVLESAGIADKDTFKDSAEGKLEDKTKKDPDEGSFKLIRPGGDSQTVYLTSSTVDMSEFIGKKVRVYGETFASDTVGWLMDVGFIEVLN